jgi:hypothetical protein
MAPSSHGARRLEPASMSAQKWPNLVRSRVVRTFSPRNRRLRLNLGRGLVPRRLFVRTRAKVDTIRSRAGGAFTFHHPSGQTGHSSVKAADRVHFGPPPRRRRRRGTPSTGGVRATAGRPGDRRSDLRSPLYHHARRVVPSARSSPTPRRLRTRLRLTPAATQHPDKPYCDQRQDRPEPRAHRLPAPDRCRFLLTENTPAIRREVAQLAPGETAEAAIDQRRALRPSA